MARRLQQTLADYVTIAISPVLIMTLVGSLVFFLVEVFYQGQYSERLHWVLGLFVIAAVLIGRISIEFGSERAFMFAAPLALVTIIAVNRFVAHIGPAAPFSLVINTLLVGIVWWSAHQLTRDCTLIDDEEDDSGEGLLQTTGLTGAAGARKRAREGAKPAAASDSPPPDPTQDSLAADGAPAKGWLGWLTGARRPHAPGVWIVYFSLAALPLFGVGQWFIPSENTASRQHAFFLLFIYVASGLGLLLTTSFLSLRRYLRRRRLQMPTPMAAAWLGTGTVLAVGLLLLALLLPRPGASFSLADRFTGSRDWSTSRYAVGNDGAEKSDNPDAARAAGEAEQQSSEAGDGRARATDDAQQAERTAGSESEGSEASSQEKAAGGSSASDRKSGGSEEGEQGSGEGDSEKPEDGGQKAGSGAESESEKAEREKSRSTDEKGDRRQGSGGSRSEKDSESKSDSEAGGQSGSRPASPPPAAPVQTAREMIGWLAQLIKWVFYAAVAIVVLVAIWRNRHALMTAAREMLGDLLAWWRRLFGGPAAKTTEASATPAPPPERPFAGFPDPFLTGQAEQFTPAELVRYTFAAVEAWGRERGRPRDADETVHEFAQALSAQEPYLAAELRCLADEYARLAYSPGSLSPGVRARLRPLWEKLHEAPSAV